MKMPTARWWAFFGGLLLLGLVLIVFGWAMEWLTGQAGWGICSMTGAILAYVTPLAGAICWVLE